MTAVASATPRRFTLFDSMVLVAALGVGSKWVHEYQQSMANFANARLGVTWSITMRYFTLAGPFLASLMLAAGGLRFLRPRPTHRRLLRSSSFIILASFILGLVITLLTILLYEMFRPSGQIRMTLFLCFMTHRMIDHTAPVIAGGCLSHALSGGWCRRRGRDWLDAFVETLAAAWLSVSLLLQLNV
jgi:hypothetical protein